MYNVFREERGKGCGALVEVSVIIPAYNAQHSLSVAVESVLRQRFSDWELILVDDGSTDTTPDLCDAFAAKDSRVRVIHKSNGGVSAARNDALDAARGEWIAFLDADDLYEEAYIASLLDAARLSGADSAACGFTYVWPNGREIDAPAPMSAGFHDGDAVLEGFVLPLLCDRVSENLILGSIWRSLFRRSALLESGVRFSGAYLEDELFLIEYFAAERSLCCVEKPLYRYLQNPASATRRYQADFLETFRRTLDAKAALVERFSIPVPDFWRDNTAWAGLLIAVANVFAPGAPGGLFSRARSLRRLCSLPLFRGAYRRYVPSGMNRNKQAVASLLRRKLFLTLSVLYTWKNRNR